MKKNRVKNVNGIKVVEPIEKEYGRELFPRPMIFKSGKDYNRQEFKRISHDDFDDFEEG